MIEVYVQNILELSQNKKEYVIPEEYHPTLSDLRSIKEKFKQKGFKLYAEQTVDLESLESKIKLTLCSHK